MELSPNNGVVVLAEDVSTILQASSGSINITFDDPTIVQYKKYLSEEVSKEMSFLHDRVDLYYSSTMVAEVRGLALQKELAAIKAEKVQVELFLKQMMDERDRAEAEGMLTRAKLTSAERVLVDVKAERGRKIYYLTYCCLQTFR
jgi:hypothetical protein